MGNIAIILVGLVIGIGIAYFIASDFSAAWENIPCIIGLILIIFIGQEVLTPGRERAASKGTYFRRNGEGGDDS